MKNFIQCCAGLLLMLTCISCSKKEKATCLLAPYALILPSFDFKVVDKTTGTDLFFSAQPTYTLSDIKVVFKNTSNKVDSLAPPMKINDGAGNRFHYIIPGNRTTDTCFIKIKNLKTDTVISTIGSIKGECAPIVTIKIQVNQEAPMKYSNGDVITIRK
ncbi:MAG: hypothetical protein AAGC65_24640 [Mucilaginibacter sp.]|uniref:hypothetical protein n=1 Tax=Mucilaginibacter sp. TaxID=1882438 RepID=UPI0031AA8986